MDSIKFKRRRFRLIKKFLLFLVFFSLIYFIGSKIRISDKYVKFLADTYISTNSRNSNSNKNNTNDQDIEIKPVIKPEAEKNYKVYIYNTHQKENYSYQKLNAYNLDYNVQYAANMLSFYLEDYGIYSIVENSDITNYMNENSMNYYQSYEASRVFLEQSIIDNPTLRLFIDLHRDSAAYEATTTNIDGKNYARVLFILGLENPNYEYNRKVINYLNDRLIEFDSSLSRGIMEKQGVGVNGVYNQDFNNNTILIELGGVYNYIDEVDNTLKVLAKAINEYILTGEI